MLTLFKLSSLPIRNLKNIILFHCCVMLLLAIFITKFINKEEDFYGKDHSGNNLDNFVENIYFSGVTLAGLGYGDIGPKSVRARLLIAIITIYMFVAAVYI